MQDKPAQVWPLLPTTSTLTTTSVSAAVPSVAAISEVTLLSSKTINSQQNTGTIACQVQRFYMIQYTNQLQIH